MPEIMRVKIMFQNRMLLFMHLFTEKLISEEDM